FNVFFRDKTVLVRRNVKKKTAVAAYRREVYLQKLIYALRILIPMIEPAFSYADVHLRGIESEILVICEKLSASSVFRFRADGLKLVRAVLAGLEMFGRRV